jgi:hypothetical protein
VALVRGNDDVRSGLVLPAGVLTIPTGTTLGLGAVARLWHRETRRTLMAIRARLWLQDDMFEEMDVTLRDLASPAQG